MGEWEPRKEALSCERLTSNLMPVGKTFTVGANSFQTQDHYSLLKYLWSFLEMFDDSEDVGC
jgi:hypothetical protein